MLTGFVPWPEDVAESYRRAGYWRGERLGDLVRPWAAADPHRVALVAGARRISYFALDRRADRLAAGLHLMGIRAFDRVIVQLPNIPEFVELALALFRIGAIPVFALPSHRAGEITYLCEQ